MTSDVIESRVRGADVIKQCAKALREEINNYDFQLDKSLCLPADIELTTEKYTSDPPTLWTQFIQHMFPYRKRDKQ